MYVYTCVYIYIYTIIYPSSRIVHGIRCLMSSTSACFAAAAFCFTFRQDVVTLFTMLLGESNVANVIKPSKAQAQ